ncbi:hypothetical protein R50345_24400 [Paenibacillus sp. FSL R5-0345]|uniref:hypothetical protein n=1 Tax=Paenibacillus sp. FSL R5-0345 TaxID=1536770 RepID=UPI0004F772EB|nr:hypothetical protein [Paenibacillus sp. FSL R5-0345]AIQ37493.1 hypothetical protein R50345_24400 [Paenibacillus sp. FSL R5-0345]
MMVIKNEFKNITFYMYLFCFIFAPPIIPNINFVLIVFAYSFFKIITKYKKEVKDVFRKSKLNTFLNLIIIAYLYILVIILIGVLIDPVNFSNYIKVIYRFFLITPVIITCILYVMLRCKELNYGLHELIKALIFAGLFQAIISISMALIPSVKDFFVSIMYLNTGDTTTQNIWHFKRRYFAFSQNVLDTFGYGTGIISVLPIFYGIYKRKFVYLLLTPILLIVPFLNSRTGLVIACIGIICLIPNVLFLSSLKEKMKFILIITGLIFISSIALNYLNEILPTTMSWVSNGVDDLLAFFNGQDNGTDSVSKLTNTMWFFPESLFLVFGTGHTVYEATGYSHSDIGYVNDLWLGGLIGSLLLYIPFNYMFLKAFRSKYHQLDRILVVFLLISFFISNIKTVIISYNVGTSVTMLLAFFVIFNDRNYKDKGIE